MKNLKLTNKRAVQDATASSDNLTFSGRVTTDAEGKVTEVNGTFTVGDMQAGSCNYTINNSNVSMYNNLHLQGEAANLLIEFVKEIEKGGTK